jgi:hypothetical protein
MLTAKKRQIGPRVKPETYDALERLAAANNCSLAYYVESMLEEHIARQRHPDTGGGVLTELLSELDNRLARHTQRQETAHSRELAAAVTRLEKILSAKFYTVNVMVDAIIRTLKPADHDAYMKTVGTTLNSNNGSLR